MNSSNRSACVSRILVLICAVMIGEVGAVASQETPPRKRPPTPDEVAAQYRDTVEIRRDQPYAATGNRYQMVDVYLPKQRKSDRPLPVVAFVHGGGWGGGTRQFFTARACEYASSGEYAAVCIGYRLTGEAHWPAQIHDCKAAIRWIRGHAGELNVDPELIGAFGGSAGGHLALLLAAAGNAKSLEGDLGEFTSLPSTIACVANICGPGDLTKPICSGRLAETLNEIVAKLLGGKLADKPDAAREASPIMYVSKQTPPILTLHGKSDSLVDFEQSVQLTAAVNEAGGSALLIPLEGVDHNFTASPETLGRIRQFFDKHLRSATVEISTEPIPRQRAIAQ